MSSAARWWTAVVISLIAAVLLALSVTTASAHQTLFDTDRWVDLVGPMGANPAVQDALSSYLADQLQGVPTVVHDLVKRSLGAAFGTNTFQSSWVALNRAAHPRVIAALRGAPSPPIAIQNNTV